MLSGCVLPEKHLYTDCISSVNHDPPKLDPTHHSPELCDFISLWSECSLWVLSRRHDDAHCYSSFVCVFKASEKTPVPDHLRSFFAITRSVDLPHLISALQ